MVKGGKIYKRTWGEKPEWLEEDQIGPNITFVSDELIGWMSVPEGGTATEDNVEMDSSGSHSK